MQDRPSKTVVIDAGIFAKLFLEESDSEDAIAFFDFARVNDLKLIDPDLFIYEVLAVAGPSIIGSSLAYDMIITFTKAGFMMIQLDEATIRQALTISNTGHAKSGFPTFYDSSYHALAVTSGGVFLTADKRHVAKTVTFGSVVLLYEWKSYFQQTQPS